jgi:hypothetical protein
MGCEQSSTRKSHVAAGQPVVASTSAVVERKEPSTCGATIEEQQALWLALACIVMRARVRNDELKKTLGDTEKLSLLITTAMRSMNREFDNKDLVKRQIAVAERDINGVDIRDDAALKTFFASRRAPAVRFDVLLPSTAERYRSLEVEGTSIVWTLDDAISCGNDFVDVTRQPNEQWLRLLPATRVDFIARDGQSTEITFRFDAQAAHVTEDHVTNPVRFTNSKGRLTFTGVPVKSKRELVEILQARSSRQGIAKGFFAPDSQLDPGRFPFKHRIHPSAGPGSETSPTTSCTHSPYKRRAVIVSGEAGSGKSTWSVYSLPQLVGAVHGVLYYSSTDAKRASMFSEIERYDREIINNPKELYDELAGLRDHLVASCATFEEVFESLWLAYLQKLPSVRERDAMARTLFCSIVSERIAKLAQKDGRNPLSPQCAFLTRTQRWETATAANTYEQYYVQTEPVDLAVVIDDVGRYPAFVRSIVGGCRKIYATFQDVFNIRLVIVLCGTGTERVVDKPGTFLLLGSDPPLAERMLVKAGTGHGIDFEGRDLNS